MKASIMSFTRNGARLSLVIREILNNEGYFVNCYTQENYVSEADELQGYEPDFSSIVKKMFNSCSLIVFIGACGIAVRAIAPYVQDKQADPAIICIDVKGTYVIPLLSGHIGGANNLSQLLAERIGAKSVITTATDLQGVFAVDQWAVKENLYISNIKEAKKISSLLLEGQSVGLNSDFEIEGNMPSQILLDENYETGIYISLDENNKPYQATLNLVPRIVYLGLGSRKGISMETVEELFLEVIEKENISIKSIVGAATIDLKSSEQGLIEFAGKHNFPLTFFSAQELGSVSGEFTESSFVRKITGVDNVCERAAVLL
ncbi:MAG: cobalamin biosynthesis protein, partial [Eubacteriales bacterium]